MPESVKFYSHAPGAPYAGFSNFSPHPFTLGGYLWETSEHYFQAHKFAEGSADFHAARTAKGPFATAKVGRDTGRPLRPDWEEVKDKVMLKALRGKFAAHASLATLLESTGDAVIVEHTAKDSYWGDGGTPDWKDPVTDPAGAASNKGHNRLGQLLMRVRRERREAAALASAPSSGSPRGAPAGRAGKKRKAATAESDDETAAAAAAPPPAKAKKPAPIEFEDGAKLEVMTDKAAVIAAFKANAAVGRGFDPADLEGRYGENCKILRKDEADGTVEVKFTSDGEEMWFPAEGALRREPCKYGAGCYRKDPTHLKLYWHPKKKGAA
eukprot:TRINITY_DN17359_c0_g1_i1.p2 TRINITY_DN17359_c0_g1~~TRINITY_DN17359_c0_g1_i1.p2  ORF type:complete len:364 (+),score=107.67 TRINITY_DN17359_c0_g1_i1:119-1093(+)